MTNYEQIDGVGVRAMVDNILVELGNEKLAESKGWTLSDLKLYETANRWETEIGATVVWVGINGKLGGILKAEDSMRPSSKDAMAKLQKLSIDTIILTGDNKGAAEMCAKNVGIDVRTNVFSSLTPNEKLNRITEEIQKARERIDDTTKKNNLSNVWTWYHCDGWRRHKRCAGVIGSGRWCCHGRRRNRGCDGNCSGCFIDKRFESSRGYDLCRKIGKALKIRQNILFSVTTKLVVLFDILTGDSWVVASRRRGCRERIDCHFQRHVDFARSQERRYKTKQDFARSRNKICRRRKGKAETVSGAATSTIAPRKFTRTFAFFRRETVRLA